MKTSFIYYALWLSFLSSCSKAPSETAATSSAEDYSTNTQDTVSAADSTGNAVNYKSESADAYIRNNQQSVDIDTEDTNGNSIKQYSVKNALKDSVRVAYNKVKPSLKSGKIDVITPDFSVNGSADYPQVSAPALQDPEDISQTDQTSAEEQPKNAVLGFSYFPQIPQNETRDLRVFVKVQGDAKQVAAKLKTIEKEDMEFTKTSDSSIVCIVKNIEAFKKLSIKPIFDPEDFRVTRVDEDVQGFSEVDPNEQLLDFKNGNYWHWKVKAVAKAAHMGNITLRIKAETPEGQKIQLAERQINIKIGINEPQLSFGQKAYRFADDHFKEILSLIIIPLVIYLFNIFKKKYNAKEASENDAHNP
ncbi:hypothetical protein [Kaistella palustris]|uniref:hypothetical protein n=1 Tax=Kaistella palustris TaxID=493376 RepID=UPI0012EC450E|nr:hypothetical protein [Kaistella palustris]